MKYCLALLASHIAFVTAFFASAWNVIHPAWLGVAYAAVLALSVLAHRKNHHS